MNRLTELTRNLLQHKVTQKEKKKKREMEDVIVFGGKRRKVKWGNDMVLM